MTPSTKKIAVTFDTNVYRNLVRGLSKDKVIEKINEINELEKDKDIKAFDSVIVGMELLANLVEGEEGFNYNDCLNSIIALSKHCNDKEINSPRIIPNIALSLEHTFFNEIKNKELELNTQNLSATIRDFRDDSDKAIKHHTAKNTFEKIKNYIDTQEQEFAIQIEKLVEGVKKFVEMQNPNADNKILRKKSLELIKSDDFLNTMSHAIVQVTFDNAGESLVEEEIQKKIEFLRNYFPLGAGFFQWISHEVIDKNIDLQSKKSKKKRWNWLWDYNVSYSVSKSSLDNREVLLVTADTDINEILTEYGFENRVMTLEEYMTFLKN